MIKLSRNIKNELLTLVGIFSFIYPAVLIIRLALFNAEGLLFNLLIDFLILFMGFLFSRIIDNKLKEFAHIHISIIISIIIIIIGGILKSSFGEFARLFFETAIVLIFYVIGYNYKNKNINNYFSDGNYKLAIFLIAIPLIMSFYFSNFLVLKPYILIFTYIFIIISIVERNRSKLEWAFKQNGVDGSVFSTKIRSYNSRLSILIFLIIVIFSNIKGIKVLFGYCLKFFGIVFLKLIY